MKKIGTLNAKLSQIIASMGHSDRLVICDCGLPIPRGAEVVDLALTRNIPGFLDTMRVVLEEFQVESAVIAGEMETVSPHVYSAVMGLLPQGTAITSVSHEEFKRLTSANGNITFVRTGEATPYANVILIAGTTFS